MDRHVDGNGSVDAHHRGLHSGPNNIGRTKTGFKSRFESGSAERLGENAVMRSAGALFVNDTLVSVRYWCGLARPKTNLKAVSHLALCD